ncbi:MAG: hypothetical protein U0X39_11170 [Bacteroidales bacterium]
MRKSIFYLPATLLLPVFILLFSNLSCNKIDNGYLIITKTVASGNPVAIPPADMSRYAAGSTLVAVDRDKPGSTPVILTGDLASAMSPSVSPDGKKMVFTGQSKSGDKWQIFEMNLANLKFKAVTGPEENCYDPAYLPNGRILFSREIHDDTTGLACNIFTVLPDGSDLKQVTFHPDADFAPTVMADGRVLMLSNQLYPEKGKTSYYVMRPDGTKFDIYTGPVDGGTFFSRASENSDGIIYFCEADASGKHGNALYCLNQNRPLHTSKKLSTDSNDSFMSVHASVSGEIYVSCRPGGTARYGIYTFDAATGKTGTVLLSDESADYTDITVAETRPRPKKLPSEVDLLVKTGQVMCQDINTMSLSMNQLKASKIEILGAGKSLGVIDVEPDGSFYLKVVADTPFRIRTIDEKGNTINGPSGWMWLRPNERRGCVGCHEDPELVPENRIPLAVKLKPVAVPVHITKLKEKSVELE